MNKTEIKKTVHEVADKAAKKANEKAKTTTGWKRWLWAAGAVIAAAIAWFTQGCTSVTPEQVSAVHAFYHEVSGEECLLAQPQYIIITEGK